MTTHAAFDGMSELRRVFAAAADVLSQSLLLAVCGLGLMASKARAESPFDTRQQLLRPLGPAAEKALAEVADKGEPLQRELLAKHMKLLLDDMQALFQFDAKDRAGLELDAAAMVALAARQWKACAVESLRLAAPRENDDDAMGRWAAEDVRVASFVQYHAVPHWTPPEKLPHWAKALEKRLGAQRAAQWLQVREEQRDKLRPSIEAFLRRWAAECRTVLDRMQEERLALLRTIADIPPAAAEAAAARLRRMMNDHVAAETAVARDMLEAVPDENLDQVMNVYTMAASFVTPEDEVVDALWRRLLAAETGEPGLRQWDEHAERSNKEKRQVIALLLEPSVRDQRVSMEEEMEYKVAGMAAALDLDDERRVKLEALAEAAINDGLQAAQEDWTRFLLRLERDGTKLEDAPDAHIIKSHQHAAERSVWREGLAKLFSKAELEQAMKDCSLMHKQALDRALTRVIVTEADQRLALDAKQRAPLEDALLNAVSKDVGEGGWVVETFDVWEALSQVPQDKLAAILDPQQMAQLASLAQEAAAEETTPPETTPPEKLIPQQEAHALLVAKLHMHALAKQKALFQGMRVRIDDAQRTLRLPPEKVARLTTAAKGAVEAAISAWRDSVAEMAATEMGSIFHEDLEHLMEEIQGACEARCQRPEQQEVWQQAMMETLDQTEQQRWRQVQEERTAYRIAAMAEVTVAEMVRRHLLTPSQCQKIRPLVSAVLLKHRDTFGLEAAEIAPWIRRCDTCVLPLGGLPKEELRRILTPRQWGHIVEDELMTAKEMWEHVAELSNHQPGLNLK